jgi:hypothetical protein
MSDQEVMNNESELVARILIQNIGDGVQILLIYAGPGNAVKNLAFITGANVSKTITVGIKRRPGGRVVESKR